MRTSLFEPKFWFGLLMSCCACARGWASEPAAPMPREVTQLLKKHCVKCHGVAKSEARLQLHTPPCASSKVANREPSFNLAL